jgi:hypothetical protein
MCHHRGAQSATRDFFKVILRRLGKVAQASRWFPGRALRPETFDELVRLRSAATAPPRRNSAHHDGAGEDTSRASFRAC